MLKRTASVLSKASALPSVRFDVGSFLLKNMQKRTFSSIWKAHTYQPRNLTLLRKCTFACKLFSSQKIQLLKLNLLIQRWPCPLFHLLWNKSHNIIEYKWLKQLQGNIVKWNVKEGDKVEVGEAVCDIETDKATLGFEMQDAGYVAKILVPEGTKGVKVGTVKD